MAGRTEADGVFQVVSEEEVVPPNQVVVLKLAVSPSAPFTITDRVNNFAPKVVAFFTPLPTA